MFKTKNMGLNGAHGKVRAKSSAFVLKKTRKYSSSEENECAQLMPWLNPRTLHFNITCMKTFSPDRGIRKVHRCQYIQGSSSSTAEENNLLILHFEFCGLKGWRQRDCVSCCFNCSLVCLFLCSIIIFFFLIGLATSIQWFRSHILGTSSSFACWQQMHLIPSSQTQVALGFMVLLNPKHIRIIWHWDPH